MQRKVDLQLFARIENGPKLPPRWGLLLAKLWAPISEGIMSEFSTPTTYSCLETVWGWVGLALTCFISLLIGTWSLGGMKKPWLWVEDLLGRLLFCGFFLQCFSSVLRATILRRFGVNKVTEEIFFCYQKLKSVLTSL